MIPRRWLIWVLPGVVVMGAVLIRQIKPQPPSVSPSAKVAQTTLQELTAQVTALEARENEAASREWGPELSAQQCGAVFERLWDALNAAANKFEILKEFPFRQICLPVYGPAKPIKHGIERFENGRPGHWAPASEGMELLAKLGAAGWGLSQSEFRHNQFQTNEFGKPGTSTFQVRFDLVNAPQNQRATLEGDLGVEWAAEPAPDGIPRVDRLHASNLRLLRRTGTPPFQSVLTEEVLPFEKTHFIDPLILYDLDGDGLSEIVLAARNLVFKRQANGTFAKQTLCKFPTGLVFTGCIADFDGDGMADFLCALFEGLMLFKGSPTGAFDEPGRWVWKAVPRLKYAQTLVCGDIDHDGDLDVWLGQYKNPFERGQMPTPYYDANDGHPSYLLLNDGQGKFSDATEAAGLAKKRWRRCYSASLADLNGDGHLDLLVVSDFSGLDAYVNDGQGHFTDLTEQWIPARHVFGMAHLLEDFDGDGRLDLLAMGMRCPTASRLDYLGLKRSGRADYENMRSAMTEGNRLFLGSPSGGFRSTPLNDSIRHSGWSWGCGALDWDNDGYLEVAIANGHETRQMVKDYESEFWLHDIYVGNSKEDLAISAYFGAKIARTRGQGWSYGGYEKNRFFLNLGGQSFLEVGHLLGLALEQDSRNLAVDDLDGDGKVDLMLTTFEAWPKIRQTLQVFRNSQGSPHHWIGFRLREEGHGVSPAGATITVVYGGKKAVRQIITGESHRVQRSNTIHFGLGLCEKVERVEIRWNGGHRFSMNQPAIDRYHEVRVSAQLKR